MINKIINKTKQLAIRLFENYRKLKRNYRIAIPVGFTLLVWYIFCLPSPLFDVPYSTVVTDRYGEMLGARIADDEQWRFPVSDTLSEKYKTCVVEFEDQYFYRHWGVNPLAIGRALKQNISLQKVSSGGSTITMQTLRMARKGNRNIYQKLVEAIQATRLEFACSKDEIIQLYAAHAPMGGNVVGIDAASWRYFGHEAKNLSWAEAATLAVLPNSPSLMHFGKNRDKLLTKRNRLLKRLQDKGVLNNVDYELAVSEPLPPRPYALPQIAPHLVTRLYKEEKGKNSITTIDKNQQEQIEAILNRWNAEFSQNGIHNIAAVVFNVQRNDVLAYCGNVNFEQNEWGNQVDVIQAPRSTGSILKPFLYAAMMDEGQLLPNQLLPDIPLNLHGFTPKNFSNKFDGAVPASEALARSLNVPSVVSLRKYSVAKFNNLLKKGGMTTLNRSIDTYGLSLVLGGAEGKLWDIGCMYLDMAHSINDYNKDGAYYERQQPTYLLNKAKETDIENTKKPLFSAGASWLTFEALTNVNRPEELDWRAIPSMQKIGWKTGTSFGFRDGWAIGITPRYVVAVWVGNADGEGRPGLIGARTAGMVMFDIFNSLPRSTWFAKPEADLKQVEICAESGCLKGLNCPVNEKDTAWVCKKGVEGDVCNYHKLVHLSESKQYQVYEDCAGTRGIVHTSWFVLPPSWEFYYREHHPWYQPLPPFSPECKKETDIKLMEFLYPYPNSTVTLPKQLDGSEGKLVFDLAHRSPQHKVFWHLDGKYIGETQNFHKKEYSPTKGEHNLIVVDETGITLTIKFIVKQ